MGPIKTSGPNNSFLSIYIAGNRRESWSRYAAVASAAKQGGTTCTHDLPELAFTDERTVTNGCVQADYHIWVGLQTPKGADEQLIPNPFDIPNKPGVGLQQVHDQKKRGLPGKPES